MNYGSLVCMYVCMYVNAKYITFCVKARTVALR